MKSKMFLDFAVIHIIYACYYSNLVVNMIAVPQKETQILTENSQQCKVHNSNYSNVNTSRSKVYCCFSKFFDTVLTQPTFRYTICSIATFAVRKESLS